jgi:RNA polymerase sigma factor (sigma-70 family)
MENQLNVEPGEMAAAAAGAEVEPVGKSTVPAAAASSSNEAIDLSQLNVMFTELYNERIDAVVGLLSAKLTDRAEAENVAHDIFAEMWRKMKTKVLTEKVEKKDLSIWLSALIGWRSGDEFRRRKKRAIADSPYVEQIDPEDSGPVPDDASADFDSIEIASECFSALPVALRQILELWKSGMSLRKIAEMVGSPVSTVQVRLNRGKELLKKMMDKRIKLKDFKSK